MPKNITQDRFHIRKYSQQTSTKMAALQQEAPDCTDLYTGVIGQCMYDYRKLSDRRWLKAPYLEWEIDVMIYPYESLNGLSISV